MFHSGLSCCRQCNANSRAMKSVALLACLTTLFLVQPSEQLKILREIKSWKTLDFAYPNAAARHAMVTKDLFIPNNSVPVDVDTYGGRVFVTTPRLKPGIPATLSTLSKQGNDLTPLLEPYPDWSWHKPDYCDGLTSVFRVKIDECGRMWVLDTGSVDIFTGVKHVCPKQIVVFDLNTNKNIRRHRFPQRVIKPDSILTTIEVDVRDKSAKCRNTYAYISDTTTYGLIVYDAKNDRSWRVTVNNLWPIPHFGYFSLHGTKFNLMDGILGSTLSPHSGNKPRTLYYQSLASNTLNYVSTSLLMNNSLYTDGVISYPPVSDDFMTYSDTRGGQSAVIAMASNGVLFYSELARTSLHCFNTKSMFKADNTPTIDADVTALQFNTGIKVVDFNGEETLLVVTNRLQKLFDGSMNHDDVNYRILAAPVSRLVAGTNCAGRHSGHAILPADRRDHGFVLRDNNQNGDEVVEV